MKILLLSISMCLVTFTAISQQKTDTISPRTDSVKVLTGVKVQASRPLVERHADKTVLNVQSDALAQTSSVFEILQRAPGVVTKGDEDIGLAGRGNVTIFLDGKPLQMNQHDLALYLKSLPGSLVDQVELISSPPANFDAAGTGGIINIRLRKNPALGTNGSAAFAYDQNTHHRFGSTTTLNHRTERFSNFLNYTFTEGLQHTAGRFDRQLPLQGKNFTNHTTDIDSWTGHNFRVGTDWFINRRSTLGLIIRGDLHHTQLATPGVTMISTASSADIDSSVIAHNVSVFPTHQFNYNINYRFEDSTGHTLIVDADYTSYLNKVNTDILNRFFDAGQTETGHLENLLGLRTGIKIAALKVDYSTAVRNIGKLETGVKIGWVNTTNSLIAMLEQGNGLVPDSGRTNDFSYRERVMAAYGTISNEWKNWEYKVGMRFEHTTIEGRSVDIQKKLVNYPDTIYLNLFPSLFLSWHAKNGGQITISYVKRITRPDYQDMNPFETVLDNYSADKGNPFLRPSYQKTIEVGYSTKKGISVAAGYTDASDVVQEITLQEGDRSLSVPENLAVQTGVYLTVAVPLRPARWWSWYCSGTVGRNELHATLQQYPLQYSTWSGNAYFNNNFQLGKGWTSQLSSWLRFPGLEGISRTRSFGSIDAALQKSWNEKKWVVRLVVNDIFNMQHVTDVASFNTVHYTYYRKWESRGVRLGLTWKFGNRQLKINTDREIAPDADRIKK